MVKRAVAKNTEIELKYALVESEYKKLLRYFLPQRPSIERQKNVYFDTPTSALRKKRYALRIRVSDNAKAKLTLKHPKKVKTKGPRAVKIRAEHECPIPLPKAQKIQRGRLAFDVIAGLKPVQIVTKAFKRMPLADLKPVGIVSTRRRNFKWNGMELTLDAFVINGHRFWELEVETEAPVTTDRLLQSFLHERSIPVRTDVPSKYGRLKRILGK